MKWQYLVQSASAVFFAAGAGAENVLRSTSLTACQDNSQFTASLLNIYYTPQNNSAYVHLIGVSSIEGYAVFDITITVYGYKFLQKTVDPCQIGLPGLCPMVAAKTDSPPFNLPVSSEAEQQIPTIAFTFPDLDAKVRAYVNMTTGDQAGHAAACLELDVSNGKTVDLVGVQWASALVILAALLASAVIGQLGHFNAASHVVVHTLALFSYFQAQAMIGLVGMPLPPIVQAWTQDFQWSLGLIKLDFMQNVLTWYQRATGGTPSSLFNSLSDVSVSVQKRALIGDGSSSSMGISSAHQLLPRSGVPKDDSGSFVVTGIQRAAFRAGIEPSNTFLTVIAFFTAMMVCAALCVLLTKAACELAVRARWINGRAERTLEFRNGWRTILKGVLFRCLLATFPALAIFCLWEFTQADSAAEVINAVVYFFASAAALAYGAYTVIRIASRSIGLHRNPAYILFSDPRTLNKWGCFYVQFRASGYYFSVPVLAHALLKAIFLAFAQGSGTAQAIGLIVIEATALGGAIYLRPWMDKSTNSFNITICVVNFINAVILLIFSNVFKQPPLGTGIVGLIFWVLNAAVTLILLLMIIVTTIVIFFRNNPDARYQYMADDRTSFVKSQVHLASNELDALAATARGGGGTTVDEDAVPGLPSSGKFHSASPGPNGYGAGPRDRLLMLDDPDETESVISTFRHPGQSVSPVQQRRRGMYGGNRSPAPYTGAAGVAAGAAGAAAAAAMGSNSEKFRNGSPSPSMLSKEWGANNNNNNNNRDSVGTAGTAGSIRTNSRNTFRGSNNNTPGNASTMHNNNSTAHNSNSDLLDRSAFPRSPATPSLPMLPAEERANLRNGSGPAAFGGMRSPGSPVYGFGGGISRSARNTPNPSAQMERQQGNANPASLSSPNLPVNYRQLRSNSPDLGRAQNSGSPSPWRRGVGYEQ